jgi:hypothetical protein
MLANGKTSKLSKILLFEKILYVQNANVSSSPTLLYQEAKILAIDYQEAKANLEKAFRRLKLGNWIHKPELVNEIALH